MMKKKKIIIILDDKFRTVDEDERQNLIVKIIKNQEN